MNALANTPLDKACQLIYPHAMMNIKTMQLHESIIRSPVSQERLALALGISPAFLSRLINGLRPMPEGMEARIHEALDRLERAERAASDARERVLKGSE